LVQRKWISIPTLQYTYTMPKNSSSAGRIPPGASRNKALCDAIIDDFVNDESEDVHIARVLKIGEGRADVFYVDTRGRPQIVNAMIEGKFRGRMKHSIRIEPGTIVAIYDDVSIKKHIIVAVLNQEQVRRIYKLKILDPRIFAIDSTDPVVLLSKKPSDDEFGFMFDTSEKPDAEDIRETRNVAAVKAKTRTLIEKEELDEEDIDAI
jgi:hypothetical protein